jgi:hypothetical protein
VRQSFKCGSIALLLTAIYGVGCAVRKAPEISPIFTAIQNISVLPIVDARAGTKASVNMENLQTTAVNALKSKRYRVTAAATSGEARQIVEEDLQSAKPEWTKKLGPTDARWVMVVCLGDVTSSLTFGSTGNAQLSGYLFDKESGENIWKGKGVGQAGQGGLAGMLMKGTMKSAALNAAMFNLVSSMPTLPKTAKR